MSEFLYQHLENPFVANDIKKLKYPSFIDENFNDFIRLRDYQKDAFNRFVYIKEKNNENKLTEPLHLAFQMATGSGKTVIMGGLILYLYVLGYRNFLFFVNRAQIIEKSRINFLEKGSSKYIFKENIRINNKEILIKEVNNFLHSDEENINICFSTVQGLYADMTTLKENKPSIDDFKDKKIVLIADEAHHINAKTKSEKEIEKNWETKINEIFKINNENILLEFSATFETRHAKVAEKYKDKIIMNYALREFVDAKYSKELQLIRTNFSENESVNFVFAKNRILSALITSTHRKEVALKYRLNINPVVLFKSKTINESHANKKAFDELISSLNVRDLEPLLAIKELENSFSFFQTNQLSLDELASKLRENFCPENTLSTNEDSELENNQKILNSLENSNIRAIFAVDKLNEGWDVLNLFDIVRLYNTRSKNVTISEAQLIGRGARYCPFKYGDLGEPDDEFKRKFDDDLGHECRILETLYFHSVDDSKYISELKDELKKMGLEKGQEEKKMTMQIRQNLKDKLQDIRVFKNKKEINKINSIDFSTFNLKKKNYIVRLGFSNGAVKLFSDEKIETNEKLVSKNCFDFFTKNILQNALCYDDFFDFKNLKYMLKDLKTRDDFLEKLKIFNIDLSGVLPKKDFTNELKLDCAINFLSKIKEEMKNNFVEFRGSEQFYAYAFSKIFNDKSLMVQKENEKEAPDNSKTWFVYDKYSANALEESLVKLIENYLEKLRDKYKQDEIFFVRNERQLKLRAFENGQGFEPDFILFVKDEKYSYQIFIEAKGGHLEENDKWKEDFLNSLKERAVLLNGEILGEDIELNDKYQLVGLKFYNDAKENEFKEDFEAKILPKENSPSQSDPSPPHS